MTTSAISIYPSAITQVKVGGQAFFVMYGPVAGGLIVNPVSASDQGIGGQETLYVDPTGAPAALMETATTVAIQPGQSYVVTPNQTTNVSVNAATSGHKFSAIVFEPPTPFPPEPQPSTFPPSGSTTLTELGGMSAYLYEEYADDDDLQAFFAAANDLAQQYVDWFANVQLAAYTNPNISGGLLDLVAQGLYGMTRPSLSSGKNRDVGPLNTWAYNAIGYNVRRLVGPSDVTVTSDDIFKRIMTWNFYKGDGRTFNIPWLKRRIMRFLLGANGSAPNIDSTDIVSVTFGPGIISIRIAGGSRKILGGAIYNRFGYNRMAYNALVTQFISGPTPLKNDGVLKEAIDFGVLQLPFQYQFVVTI